MNLKDYLFYQDDWCKIYCGDCREILPMLKPVDLVLTDPPYGLGMDKQMYKNANKKYGKSATPTKNYGESNWDIKVENQIIQLILTQSKDQIIWGGQYYTDILPVRRCWLVWDKRCQDNMTIDFADCELAWTSFDKPQRIFRYLWNGMLQGNMGKNKEERFYPTQKPEPLIKWCIKNYSNPFEIILDPFLGSGTTCVAAKNLNHKSIGIDISERCCRIAVKRLRQEVFDFRKKDEGTLF